MENPFVSSRSETSLQMIRRPAPVQTKGAFLGGVSDESEIDEIGAKRRQRERIFRAGVVDPSG